MLFCDVKLLNSYRALQFSIFFFMFWTVLVQHDPYFNFRGSIFNFCSPKKSNNISPFLSRDLYSWPFSHVKSLFGNVLSYLMFSVQVCCGTCRRVMPWRCPLSRMPWPCWPTLSSSPTRAGPPRPIRRTANCTCTLPRFSATPPAASGQYCYWTLGSINQIYLIKFASFLHQQ